MKFGTVLLTIFFSVCALGGVVWLGHFQPMSVKANKALELRKQHGLLTTAEIEASGPQPKAVAGELVFNFGQAIVGNEYSHVFTLKNEGKVPLTLEKGFSTCKCTISSLEEGKTLEVLPGESVEITLTWNPTKPDAMFSHSAEVLTNDPKSRIVAFEIEGEVIARIIAMPPEIWVMPDILDGMPTKFFGYIFSAAPEGFQIEEIKTSNPLLSAERFKLSKDELAQYQMKSGYRIDLELKQGVPVGPFNETLSLITNLEELKTFTVNVRSHRFGPMTIRRLKNCRWSPTEMGVAMDSFAASEGRTSTLLLNVHGLDGELEFRDITGAILLPGTKMEADPKFLKFSYEPDTSYTGTGKGARRYLLTFEVPPGSPKAIHRKESAARVHLKTNHPEVPELNFVVHFISR